MNLSESIPLNGKLENMKLLFSIFIILMFMGCETKVRVGLPSYATTEPVKFFSEGIIHNGVKGEFVTFPIWQEIQNTSIQNRLRANSCAEVIEKFNKTIK